MHSRIISFGISYVNKTLLSKKRVEKEHQKIAKRIKREN